MQYHLLHFKEIDSTNSYLKNSYKLLDNFTFASTDFQSHGKGRADRVWQSNSGENLMFSFLIKDQSLMKKSAILSIMTAVEIAKELERYNVGNISVKWPNDVLIDDKKVCGILLEGQVPEYLVIGVGLNVNQKEFPEGLRRPATSLSLSLNKDIDIDDLKNRLFSNIVNNLSDAKNEDYLDYFRKHNYLQNKRVRAEIDNQVYIGEVVGIDDSFCLQVLSRDMLLHIDSGEIEIL